MSGRGPHSEIMVSVSAQSQSEEGGMGQGVQGLLLDDGGWQLGGEGREGKAWGSH